MAENTLRARIEQVDTHDLRLGKASVARITIRNAGDLPIIKVRITLTAGRDFGFPLGYQSRTVSQEFTLEIPPGESRIIEKQGDLPRKVGPISLVGLYEVTVRVYANDVSTRLDEWKGEVSLSDT